ncbi:MAG: hydroxymethylbilane synthase [Verrucomicrobia bacterium]|nr:hydroxymethylbilane synthase [Verrucomicrobiota bacterium]NBU68023.1 hydroxymethylbilane synthase [Verrucomicrobiota bacterium]NDC00251.1 hydroxymethylbilane synthase [Verrucomicrobiota bacterium]NDF17329.1 hydroxymethylbilane synthase [Verrucomicrobiota bacterium]
MKIRLGTRGSRLALWQAHRVADLIRMASPGTGVELVIIRTSGDVRSEFGEEPPEQAGEFSSELERGLCEDAIDAAIHSAKDLPTQIPKNLVVAAYPERADPRDALIQKEPASKNPPKGAIIATGSPRRDMLWRERWGETTTKGIRGNVDRRMQKLKEDPALWGMILACAGIDRLGGIPEKLVMERLDADWMVPAPGQGALAVECRSDDRKVIRVLRKIDNSGVRACVEAEKGFLRNWGGGCSESLGALATLGSEGTIHLRTAAQDHRGQVRRAQMEGPTGEAELIGVRLAEEMRRG